MKNKSLLTLGQIWDANSGLWGPDSDFSHSLYYCTTKGAVRSDDIGIPTGPILGGLCH